MSCRIFRKTLNQLDIHNYMIRNSIRVIFENKLYYEQNLDKIRSSNLHLDDKFGEKYEDSQYMM